MTEVKQFPLGSSPVWYSNYFYVNLCTRNHDNSSCTDLQQVPDGDGKFIKEMASIAFLYQRNANYYALCPFYFCNFLFVTFLEVRYFRKHFLE